MKLISSVVFVAAALAGFSAQAADGTLFDQLGGKPGIVRIVDTLLPKLTSDPRISATFEGIDMQQLSLRLKEQICVVADGPCTYRGKDMKTIHDGLHLTSAHFNALVEDLQDAMDQAGLAPAVQNRLLARLAPMHRDVVQP